jgi:hypothetical protein
VPGLSIVALEKIVVALTGLSILTAGTGVTVFSFINKSSGISEEAVISETNKDAWLSQLRELAAGGTGGSGPIFVAPPAPAQAPVAPAGQTPAQPTTPGQAAAPSPSPQGHIAQAPVSPVGDSIPQHEQVRGIPWVRQEPGVQYFRPVPVSPMVYAKYQAFDDAYQEALRGGGEFVQSPGGAGYQVNWLDENSVIRKQFGIRAGDVLISVNGHPIGQSMTAGRQLYDQLKNEKRFLVKVYRPNQGVIGLSAYVK